MQKKKFILTKTGLSPWKAYFVSMLIVLANMSSIFATEAGILSATDVGTKTIIDRVIIWCDTTALPVVALGLIISMLIFCKDEKILPLLKKAAKIIVLAAILLNGFWLVMKTLQWVWGVISQGNNSTIFASTISNITNSFMC